MIIGAVSSFLMMVIALIVSYVMYYNGTKNEFLNNIDQVIDEVKFEVSNENYDADIFEVQNYVLENMPEESKEFSSEAEKRNYYREAFSQLYPAKSGTTGGMAFGFSRLTGQYTSVISFLRSKAIVTGSIVYLAYFDLDNNQIIYLGDSRDDENAIYYYTGSKYSIGNDIDNYVKQYEQTGRHDRMIIDGKTTKLTSLERNNQYLATIVVEYDLKVVSSVANEFLTTCLIIFSIGFVLLLILYFFLTHFLLINNLLKLNNATKEFSGLLSENKPNVINVKIRSHDEIKELSNSFETLENEIIEYSKRIEREALEREKINAELSIASRIQIETLPKNEYIDNNVILNAYIKPAKGVGGDFYDYFYVDNKLVVIISDVSGKGIPAALFMMKSKELLKSKITKASNLEDSIFDVNNELLENNAEGLFITAFVGIIDFDKLEFTYINCGHEKPYLISNNEIIRLGEESNFIIGGINDFKYKLEKNKLKENDKLFLFTDGLNESIDSNRIEFGYDNITNNLKY